MRDCVRWGTFYGRLLGIFFSSARARCIVSLLNRENGRGEAGIESGGLNLEVEDESLVDELLDVEGNLGTVDGSVVAELDFHGGIEKRVVVGVDVETERDRQERGGIEEEVELGMVLEGWITMVGSDGRRLDEGEVLDGLVVVGFMADVRGDCARG